VLLIILGLSSRERCLSSFCCVGLSLLLCIWICLCSAPSKVWKYFYKLLVRLLASQHGEIVLMLQVCEENTLIPGASFLSVLPFPSLSGAQMDKKVRESFSLFSCVSLLALARVPSLHRITELQNCRHWREPLWVI